ncbi:putative bifunctional diguanylate cyclase/phosphodiesterase [Paraurantiacibacter namhicola]|uniref:Phytochrome-like protein cph2 n=1 Tax=Paraurantiacibacter namhicola TaxID=645517 RepID=A0A1C7D7K9_9SPHN|nr:EAL domain-containing protein [Paraurantiacibacter namhicola]ANU07464.1 Phytochrome-like protein cph2 [Paraurantiacibacter namhicola]
MSGSTSKIGAFARRALQLDLIDHRVEERDSEWWSRCKLNHTAAFPYLTYDTVRSVGALILCYSFLETWLIVCLAVVCVILGTAQFMIDREVRLGRHSSQKIYRALRDLVVVRACVWGALTAVYISAAPPEFLPALIPAAMLFMLVDGLCMIAIPRRAMVAVSIQCAGIVVPLAVTATGPALLGVGVAISGLVFMHWAVFNLNYMFATRRLRTRTLREANDTIQLLLNQYDEDGSDWLIECDEDGAILRPNARFCKAAKRSAEEMDGMRLSLLFDDSPQREELRAIGVREENFRNLILPLHIEGEQQWWSISARPVYKPDGSLDCWRGFIADVTRTRKAEEKVTYMAHYDVLTNLPNRSLFNTTLKRSFGRRDDGELAAVLYVDLDHFKAINDTYGHAKGDVVLAEAGRRIEQAVDSHAMVARLGGDEFAVLMDRINDRSEAMRAAEAIVTAMDEPIDVDGQLLPIGASVGVAFGPDNGTEGDEVLRAADLALYDAKSRGRRGASVFDPAMQDEVQDRRSMELDLRAALTRGELELHYQPLLDVESGDIAGYEALLRWNHPERGSVSPAVFIPVAEETGQIIAIGAWVIREALRECATWPEHLSVSVNLSPAQMRDEGLLNTIVGALASSRVSSDRLELEITENLLMQDNEDNISLLHKIRGLGVKIALDDFGTGYSSLNYLRSFPFDKIKIDRCFVSDIADRDDSDAIVDAVVSLAGKLNMRTTAEGVENDEQLAKLRLTGCTQVQGFLFSKARPAAELDHGDAPRPAAHDGGKVTHIDPAPRQITTAAKDGRKAG